MKRFETVSNAISYAQRHGAVVLGSSRINFPKPIGIKVLGVADFLSSHGYIVSYERSK